MIPPFIVNLEKNKKSVHDRYMLTLDSTWQKVLESEFNKPYMQSLFSFIAQERARGVSVYPEDNRIFAALAMTSLDKVKVVIVGQDPYHGPGQANGLCFSVNPGVVLPPSLKNIFKELKNDLGGTLRTNGCLDDWAAKGVLLLNVTLTVAESDPLSHHGRGWEQFTDAVLQSLCTRGGPLVFMLWGKNAEQKCLNIKGLQSNYHLVLTAAHPSPFSAYRGFFGCAHFSKANTFLVEHGLAPIDFIK